MTSAEAGLEAFYKWRLHLPDSVMSVFRPESIGRSESLLIPFLEALYMSNWRKLILGVVCLFAVAYLATWFVHRSNRTTEKFAAHIFHAQYSDAAEMLTAPCSVRLEADGGLTLVDRTGKSTVVPPGQLPFKVGGGQPDATGDFSMIALGSSTNGMLDAPAIIMYLSVDGGKICIDHVDS